MSSQQQVNAVLSVILAACCWEDQSIPYITPLTNSASQLYFTCPRQIVEIDSSTAKSVTTNFSPLIKPPVLFQLAQLNTAEHSSSEPVVGKGLKVFDSDGNGHKQEEEQAGLQNFAGHSPTEGTSPAIALFS